MRTPRVGSLHILKPVGLDARDARVIPWTDYLVKVVQPRGCPKNGTLAHCYVETLTGDFIGLVLLASLQPLDRKTKLALRREGRRLTTSGPVGPGGEPRGQTA